MLYALNLPYKIDFFFFLSKLKVMLNFKIVFKKQKNYFKFNRTP